MQLVLDNIWSLYDAVVTNRSVKRLHKCASYTVTLLKLFWCVHPQRQREGGKDCVLSWAEGDDQRLEPLRPQGASLRHLSSVVASVFSCSLYPFNELCVKKEDPANNPVIGYLQYIQDKRLYASILSFSLTQLLAMVCEKLPSPLEMTSERAEKLLSLGTRQFNSLPEKTQELKQGIVTQTQHTMMWTLVLIFV